MVDWDETGPADDDVVSAYPADERAARDAVKTIFDIDHHAANDTSQGRHDLVTLVDKNGDTPAGAADTIRIWQEDGEMKGRVGTGDAAEFGKLPGVGFETGTKLLFPQATAPTGWTQDTDVNDKVLRVVDGDGTGGAEGGTWTISGLTVNGHTLTIDEIPAHTHPGVTTFINNFTVGNSGGATNPPMRNLNTSAATGSAGGGESHNHGLTADGDWRPAYLDVIKASKD